MWVQPVVEDILQEAVLQKIISVFRPDIELYPAIGHKGNSYIKERLGAFHNASRHTPYIVLTDLDRRHCAPELISDWVNFTVRNKFLFRIIEREVDAWILADRISFSQFMGISITKIPNNTSEILDPKEFVIDLARKSKKRKIKEMIPVGMSSQGPGYNSLLQDYVTNIWEPNQALKHNGSLKKTIDRLVTF